MRLTRSSVHHGWDNSLAPRLRIQPGDEVVLDLVEASGGQLSADSSATDLGTLDFDRLNPVTGPIEVAGAEPGDAIVVSVLELDTQPWGWSGIIPGFGLLADQFTDPHLYISRVDDGRVHLPFGAVVPAVPMVGTIGVALPEPGVHSVIPPSRFGGNLDIRHITAGAVLRLPVGVAGALLSVGDAHAAMGDGEVCGTGIEADANVRLRIELEKASPIKAPRYTTSTLSDRSGPAIATTGVGPDLFVAAHAAATELIDEIVSRTGIAAADAYVLASVAADLKISEIVDAPNWVVSMHLPVSVLG